MPKHAAVTASSWAPTRLVAACCLATLVINVVNVYYMCHAVPPAPPGMGHRAPDSPAIAKPSRRRSLLNLCLAPHVKDEDGVKHTKRRPASAPGSPRTTKQSPKSVHFSEFPTIHTYCVEYEDEGSNSSVASAVNSNVAAQDHNASRGAGSRQYQLLSRTSNTCPHLQVQDDNNSVSSWARRVAAAKDIHAAAHVHCSSDNSPAADAAVASPPDTPAEHLQLSDEQLAVLSRLDVSQQAALQCDAEQLFTSSTGQQQLGRGAHSEVSQAVLPWPSAEAAATAIAAAAEETGLNSTALLTAAAAGLPVVVKAVAHERFQGDGLFNIEGRKREEKFSRMVASSPYFPRLYRAVHMKRRSYFLFSSMTAQPATLVQYVQFRQQVLDTAIPAAASSQPGEQQLHQPVSGANSSSPQAPISTHAASCTATWQDSVLQILDDIAQGLDHLHTLGLLHLDLKPGNVIIRQGGRAYLIDLGVACEVGTSLEQHGRCGTEAFMDPEV